MSSRQSCWRTRHWGSTFFLDMGFENLAENGAYGTEGKLVSLLPSGLGLGGSQVPVLVRFSHGTAKGVVTHGHPRLLARVEVGIAVIDPENLFNEPTDRPARVAVHVGPV